MSASHFPLTKLGIQPPETNKPIENEHMNSHPVLIVLAIAVAAPLLTEITIRLRVVVLEMVLGIIIGPQVLGLATAEGCSGSSEGNSGWRLCSSWQGWNSISNGFGAAR